MVLTVATQKGNSLKKVLEPQLRHLTLIKHTIRKSFTQMSQIYLEKYANVLKFPYYFYEITTIFAKTVKNFHQKSLTLLKSVL